MKGKPRRGERGGGMLEWFLPGGVQSQNLVKAGILLKEPMEKKQKPGRPEGEIDSRLERLNERKRFICLTREDEKILAELRPTFIAHAEEVADAFYAHLLEFEPLREFLSDPTLIIRLKNVQKKYLISLTSGSYEMEYLEDRLKIGRTHEVVGLLPQWYMGTYSFYIDLLTPLVIEQYQGDRDQVIRACHALSKLMNLDAQIVLEVYFDARQQKAVERSERLAAVGELAASIAHEVRNPLAGMKGALEVLRKGLSSDPAKREVMDELVAQIVRLEILVRDLLTFAQPRPLNRQPVKVHELLDRVVRFVQEGFDSTEIEVRQIYQAKNDTLSIDAQQLEQVFLNLIDNAVQSMEEGGRLTLKTRGTDQSVMITFADTGKGIPPANLQRIFHPFFTTKHRGSGLGLSIVQKIVEAHNGSLDVESTLGEGTEVTIQLPRKESANGT